MKLRSWDEVFGFGVLGDLAGFLELLALAPELHGFFLEEHLQPRLVSIVLLLPLVVGLLAELPLPRLLPQALFIHPIEVQELTGHFGVWILVPMEDASRLLIQGLSAELLLKIGQLLILIFGVAADFGFLGVSGDPLADAFEGDVPVAGGQLHGREHDPLLHLALVSLILKLIVGDFLVDGDDLADAEGRGEEVLAALVVEGVELVADLRRRLVQQQRRLLLLIHGSQLGP